MYCVFGTVLNELAEETWTYICVNWVSFDVMSVHCPVHVYERLMLFLDRLCCFFVVCDSCLSAGFILVAEDQLRCTGNSAGWLRLAIPIFCTITRVVINGPACWWFFSGSSGQRVCEWNGTTSLKPGLEQELVFWRGWAYCWIPFGWVGLACSVRETG